MKTLILSFVLAFSVTASFSQSTPPEQIKFDSTVHTNFNNVWKTALLNQAVIFFDRQNKPLMMIMLPSNGDHSPTPGVYPIVEGNRRAVKKGTQVAKMEYEPGYHSAENGGTLTITENDGIFYFKAENVIMLNAKNKRTTYTKHQYRYVY